MTAETMANEICQFVNNRGGALMHEIIRHLGAEAEGDQAVVLADHPNVVLWCPVSELFVRAFDLALSGLEIHRAAPLAIAFFSDNLGFPQFPLVTAEQWRGQKLDFVRYHWLPAVLFGKQAASAGVDAGTQPKRAPHE